MIANDNAGPRPNPLLKGIIDYVPLVAFFCAFNWPQWFRPVLPAILYEGEKPGMFVATAVLMPVTLAAVLVSWTAFRKIPAMLLFTAAIVAVFGGLTLYFHDPEFIKMKLTIIYCVFAAVLLGGLAAGRNFLPMVFNGPLKLDDAGWRILTIRTGLFFLGIAGLNEVIRRTQSDAVWVNFKLFGTVAATFLFMLSQMPLFIKHDPGK